MSDNELVEQILLGNEDDFTNEHDEIRDGRGDIKFRIWRESAERFSSALFYACYYENMLLTLLSNSVRLKVSKNIRH